MKIFALKVKAGCPLIELLCANYDNSKQENHIEIARKYWLVEPNERKAIILVLVYREGKYGSSTYTYSDFQRTYQNPLIAPAFPIVENK